LAFVVIVIYFSQSISVYRMKVMLQYLMISGHFCYSYRSIAVIKVPTCCFLSNLQQDGYIFCLGLLLVSLYVTKFPRKSYAWIFTKLLEWYHL